MATCPQCSIEVPEGAVTCPACGAALESGGEPRACPECGAPVPADAEACPACGHLERPVPCASHPERMALGACVVCGRPTCEACDQGRENAYLCEAHGDVEVVEGWAEVYSTGDDVEANLVRDNLLAEGIDAQVLSQKDHFAFTVDLGDLAEVRVLVPAYEYEDAMSALAAHADAVRDIAFACPACGAAYEAGDATCGACGASLIESAD